VLAPADRPRQGQEDDWFGSNFITALIVIAAAGLVALVIWEWFQKEPIVDVRLFKNFNVATTNLMFLVLGAALFSSTVLMPQLLQTLMGYQHKRQGWCFRPAPWWCWLCSPWLANSLPDSKRAISSPLVG